MAAQQLKIMGQSTPSNPIIEQIRGAGQEYNHSCQCNHARPTGQDLAKLAATLCKVMQACAVVPKDKSNPDQGYKYVSSDAILCKANHAFVEAGLATVCRLEVLDRQLRTTRSGSIWELVTTKCTLTIIDSETGCVLESEGVGQGFDISDKAFSKSQTQAKKYSLMLMLNISTGEDPESDRTMETTTEEPIKCKHCKGKALFEALSEFEGGPGQGLCLLQVQKRNTGEGMIEIPLTRGKTAIVDDEDSYVLEGRKWQASREGKETSISWYAIQGKRPRIRMHRLIMGHILNRPLRSGEQIDHINHNGLDNRRSNLRIATANENQQNARLMNTPKSSKYKGVTWNKHAKQWKAAIRVSGRRDHLGHFRVEEDAAKAYNLAAKKYFGEFAEINNVTYDPERDAWIERLPGKPGRCDACKAYAKYIGEGEFEGKPVKIYYCEKCRKETRKAA